MNEPAPAPEASAPSPEQERKPARRRFPLGAYGLLAAAFWIAGAWFLLSGAALYSRANRIESGAADASELARSARSLGFGESFIPHVSGIDPETPPEIADRARQRLAQGVRANARSSTVFGLFCLIVGAFWFGFGKLDPAISGRLQCK